MNGHKWNRNKNKNKRICDLHGERKKEARKPLPKPHETEEEAIIRRFHDAQRMARFRAKRKKALEEAKALAATPFNEMSVISEFKKRNVTFKIANSIVAAPNGEQFQACLSIQNPPIVVQSSSGESKYSQLLAVIEELGKDIRLTYAGSRTSIEKLKIGIVRAKMLVRDCLLETEVNSQQ